MVAPLTAMVRVLRGWLELSTCNTIIIIIIMIMIFITITTITITNTTTIIITANLPPSALGTKHLTLVVDTYSVKVLQQY